MIPEDIDSWLAHSLDDRRFSRNERQALGEFIATLSSSIERDAVRRRAFEVARAALAQLDATQGARRQVGSDAARSCRQSGM